MSVAHVETMEPVARVLRLHSVPVEMNPQDDGHEYACVVTMATYQENASLEITVLRKLNNSRVKFVFLSKMKEALKEIFRWLACDGMQC